MKQYGEEKKRKKHNSIKNCEVEAEQEEEVLPPLEKKGRRKKNPGKMEVDKSLNFTETRYKDLLKKRCCIKNCVLNLGFQKTALTRTEFWSVSLNEQWRKVAQIIETGSDWVKSKKDDSEDRVGNENIRFRLLQL